MTTTIASPLPHTPDDLYCEGIGVMICQWFFGAVIRQTAGEVARECQAAVWEKVREKTGRMTPAQARGYVRAIAPAVILREVDAVLCRRRVRVTLRRAVIVEATEQLLRLVANDVRQSQVRPALRVRAMAA